MKLTILSFVSLIALAACQPAEGPADQTRSAATTDAPVAEQVIIKPDETTYNDGTYTLNWSFKDTSGPVRIELITRPDETSGELLTEGITDTSYSWTPADAANVRHYFLITPENGESVVTATRLLPLEGGRNFRTLGGYDTTDGHTVVWDKLYRSGIMTGLTEHDYDYLSSLGIKVICDLRTEEERASEPTSWAAGKIDYLTFPDPESHMGFMSVLMKPDATPQDVRNAFGGSYFGIAHQQAPAYEAMFDHLAAGDAPLAFNCSAGKDRTGIAAALLLSVLGVPRETIVHDYQLSDDYVDYMKEFMSEEARAKMLKDNPSYAFFLNLPSELVAPIMATYPEYIETFFDAIEAEYGSTEAFLKQKINLTDEEMAAIRVAYLK